MIRKMPVRTYMSSSTAHVFIRFFTPDGQSLREPHPRDTCYSLVSDIQSRINPNSIYGRLWIRPVKVPWPESMGDDTPNGLRERTVWAVAVPRGKAGSSYSVYTSFDILRQWLKSTGLPLRIAIVNDGSNGPYSYYSMLMDSDARATEALIKKYLDDWDVEVYTAENDYFSHSNV